MGVRVWAIRKLGKWKEGRTPRNSMSHSNETSKKNKENCVNRRELRDSHARCTPEGQDWSGAWQEHVVMKNYKRAVGKSRNLSYRTPR